MSVKTKIKVAHSPDSDDAFMFYAIAKNKIDLGTYEFEITSDEIQKLNQQALEGSSEQDIFAVSFHAYAYLADKYQILRPGASMGGENYGPRVVVRDDFIKNDDGINKFDLSGLRIAVPGELTSAYLCLQLYQKEKSVETFEPVFCSFDEVFDLLQSGKVDAALLIHESQLKYKEEKLSLLVDLGKWWYESNKLQMPLGCNVIRRSLGEKAVKEISDILQRSIVYGLENFEETLEYARSFSNNGLSDEKAKEYINMYVNESTVSLSDDDIKSISLMLEKAYNSKLLNLDSKMSIDPI